MKSAPRLKKSGHKDCINCIDAKTLDSNLFASGSEDKSIRIWDIRAERAIKCITQCFESPVEAVKFSLTDENTLYAGSGKCLYSFDLRTEGILIRSPVVRTSNAATDEINAIALQPGGDFLSVADDAGIITIVNTTKLTAYKPKRFRGHTSLVNAVAFSPINSSGFFSGGFDYQICGWDLAAVGDTPSSMVNMSKLGNDSHDEFSAKSVNPPFVQALSYVCDGQAIAIALGDGSVKVVSADDPYCLLAAAYDAHAGMVTALYTTGNNFIFSGGIDRTIKCWRLDESRKAESIVERNSLTGAEVSSEGEIVDADASLLNTGSSKEVEKIDKKKKKKKKNKRFAGNSHPMQFSLIWDEDHEEKINVICGFRMTDACTHSDKIFVGDVSSDITVYNVES